MKKYSVLLSSFCVLLAGTVGCAFPDKVDTSLKENIPINEHMMLAVLWQQRSAEYKALSHQAFNIATERILNLEKPQSRPLAIITDIDETVLDNSPYSGMQIQTDVAFDKSDWIEWGKLRKARAIPGAVDFFNLADSLGIQVFYISNRYQEQIEETIENMKTLGLPNADSLHVFLKTSTSKKQERRDRILKDYEVVLYLGDNLSDFASVFDDQGTESRNRSVEEMREFFGKKFIVFPNPTYGDWESKGIYEGNRNWTLVQKDSIRHSKIFSYK